MKQLEPKPRGWDFLRSVFTHLPPWGEKAESEPPKPPVPPAERRINRLAKAGERLMVRAVKAKPKNRPKAQRRLARLEKRLEQLQDAA